jgi:Tat protein secretion system quality control protein TatD with DNase activity
LLAFGCRHHYNLERTRFVWVGQVERAAAAGVSHLMITGGCLEDAKAALALARDPELRMGGKAKLHCTVGVHPTRAGEFGKPCLQLSLATS